MIYIYIYIYMYRRIRELLAGERQLPGMEADPASADAGEAV